MMKIHLPEGTTLTGAAETIVRIMRDSHWTVGEESIEVYMERARDDAMRPHGVRISTESPEAFLASLAEHKMITIEEVA